MNSIDTFDNKGDDDEKDGEKTMALPATNQQLNRHSSWVTTGQAKKMLGVSSVNTVKRWAAEGKLVAQKFDQSGWMRISVDSIDRLLQSSDANVKTFQNLKKRVDATSDLDFEVTEEDASLMSDRQMGTLPWEK